MSVSPTRERLVTEAMRLFGEQGYQATSVAQIEAAAGLAPGSGALYHHFKSKEALLEAGIDRQLDRRRAMRDIRALFAGLGDLRSELTMLGRYLLSRARRGNTAAPDRGPHTVGSVGAAQQCLRCPVRHALRRTGRLGDGLGTEDQP